MNSTKDILVLTHYSIMFDECWELLRQYIYRVLREFLCLY